jgi:tetratricopeptide (TPR) repeat protein
MKKIITIISFLFFANIVHAQTAATLITDAQKLETTFDEAGALNKYKEALKLAPQNMTALSRCSELCSSIGNKQTITKNRDIYFQTALVYAQTGLRLYPESDVTNISMAIAVGRIVLTKSGKEKIVYVKDLKAYAEKAIKINPSNFKGWHILGKWHYEVANLTALERAAAKLFFGALPAASFANAIICYEKAKTLNPNFLLNYLELGRVYKKTGDTAKAKAALTTLQGLKNSTPDDATIKNQAKTMLDSL